MRHVQRTHREKFDWLYERLRNDRLVSMRHVNIKFQLADIFTMVDLVELFGRD